jgi:hypothetical protein
VNEDAQRHAYFDSGLALDENKDAITILVPMLSSPDLRVPASVVLSRLASAHRPAAPVQYSGRGAQRFASTEEYSTPVSEPSDRPEHSFVTLADALCRDDTVFGFTAVLQAFNDHTKRCMACPA